VTTQDLRYLNYRRLDKECQVFSTEEILQKQKTSTRSNSLIERNIVSSNRTNSLIEDILNHNSDIIEKQWEKRHAKYCYKFGIARYSELIHKARKYGKNPTALLASMINNEMSKKV